jgi:hypothetical protein
MMNVEKRDVPNVILRKCYGETAPPIATKDTAEEARAGNVISTNNPNNDGSKKQ